MSNDKPCLNCDLRKLCDKKLSVSGGYVPCEIVNGRRVETPRVKSGIKP